MNSYPFLQLRLLCRSFITEKQAPASLPTFFSRELVHKLQFYILFTQDGLTEVRGNFVHMHSTDNTIIQQNNIESSIVSSVCMSQLIGRLVSGIVIACYWVLPKLF